MEKHKKFSREMKIFSLSITVRYSYLCREWGVTWSKVGVYTRCLNYIILALEDYN